MLIEQVVILRKVKSQNLKCRTYLQGLVELFHCNPLLSLLYWATERKKNLFAYFPPNAHLAGH